MRTFNRIRPMADDAFERWQRRVRENEAAKSRAIAKQHGDDMGAFVEKMVERVVPDAAVVIDPDAPDGRCPECKEAFTRTASGRLADHVCPTVPLPSEREIEEQRRMSVALERPIRSRRGAFGYDEDDE